MAHRNSKHSSKKGKSKKSRAKNDKYDLSKRQQKSQKSPYVDFSETISDTSTVENENNNANTNESISENSETNITNKSTVEANDSNTTKSTAETGNANTTTKSTAETSPNDTNDCCEELKAKQQELLNNLKNLSDTIAALALIRDNVNSIRVDTLTELYFTRQVRPLLDALNIISFASYNMSYTASTFQGNAFGEKKEIKNSLKLSYKMNNEVDDIINALGRRLAIFLNLIEKMDKNCPPFINIKEDS